MSCKRAEILPCTTDFLGKIVHYLPGSTMAELFPSALVHIVSIGELQEAELLTVPRTQRQRVGKLSA